MTEFKFSCPRCEQHIACDESNAGLTIQCPTCQANIIVPGRTPSEPALPPSPKVPVGSHLAETTSPRATASPANRSAKSKLALVAVAAGVVVLGIVGSMLALGTKNPPVQSEAPPALAKDAPPPARREVEAPDFTLFDLAGNAVRLSKQQGQVIILDFWATWCPPCRQSLPVLSEVAAAYDSKGVVFYAVNQKEDEATIHAFQKSSGLLFKVLLDTDGKVGQMYGAKAIPRTVLIDQTGHVRGVHVGYSPQLKERLTRQLDRVLGNKP